VAVSDGGRLASVTSEPAASEQIPAPRADGAPAAGAGADPDARLDAAFGAAPVTIRPRKVRRVCWVLAPVVVVLFTVLGVLLSGSASEGDAPFQTSDRVAMVVLGLFVAAAILLFTRPKVIADTTHIKITNVIGGYDLPWAVVRSVRFDRGNPWVSLELQDDDVVAVMAVQAADKDHALASVRTLRTLLAASSAPSSAPSNPPLAPI
jgi:hypothetical protein